MQLTQYRLSNPALVSRFKRHLEIGSDQSCVSVEESALAETVIRRFKAAAIHRRGYWHSYEAVEFTTLERVDRFNNRRLLELIRNIPPAAAKARFYAPSDQPAMVV